MRPLTTPAQRGATRRHAAASHRSEHERDDDMTTTSTTGLATAELAHVDASNGVTYAYRRFGTASTALPVVFLQHFRGNIDNWDPALVDGVAAHREVILFDNAGVGGSTGTTPTPSSRWPSTLRLPRRAWPGPGRPLRLLPRRLRRPGDRPHRPGRVRRLVLAGTGPKGAPGMEELVARGHRKRRGRRQHPRGLPRSLLHQLREPRRRPGSPLAASSRPGWP